MQNTAATSVPILDAVPVLDDPVPDDLYNLAEYWISF